MWQFVPPLTVCCRGLFMRVDEYPPCNPTTIRRARGTSPHHERGASHDGAEGSKRPVAVPCSCEMEPDELRFDRNR